MVASKRIDFSLFADDVKTLINASAKIFPVAYSYVTDNLNPLNYEYVKVIGDVTHKNEVYLWDETNGFDLLGADDLDINWVDVKEKPSVYPPSDHIHTNDHLHENKFLLDNLTQSNIDTWNTVTSKSDNTHNHDAVYYTETEIDNKLSNKSDITHNHSTLYQPIGSYSLTGHTHSESEITDLDKYTQAEVTAFLANKSDTSHTHDGRYFTESEVNTLLGQKAALSHAGTHVTGGTDVIVDAVASGNSGLLSGSDKAKLDGIAINANNYVLPIANTTTLGGIKSGTGITVDTSGNVSLNSHTHTISNITALQTTLDGKENVFAKNTAFNKNFGSASGTVCQGNDARLSDARTPLTHTHTVSDVTNFPTLGTVASKNIGTTNGTIPILDANGKLDTSILPAIAINDTHLVDSEVEMLALTAQTGDVAVRSDEHKSYILKNNDPTLLTNWQELLTPTDAVTSVAGKTGVVTLTASDVGLGNVVNESKSTMFTSPAFTGTPTAPTATTGTNTTQLATTAFVQASLSAGGYGDMLKSVYDTTGNGVVDNAEKVNGLTVQTAVPSGAVFTDTVTTINGKTGAIAKADIVALGIPSSDTNTVTTINGKTGAIVKDDIVALGIPAQDTVYTHPSTHAPSIIAQDASNRFVTDTEKSTWNGKETAFTKNTAFNKNYETTATNIKINGTQSVGTLDTIARADHVHPTDTTRAASSHTHGNITNAGAIGSTSGLAVVTTTSGVLTTGTIPVASGGTGATTAAGALTNLGLTATAIELNYSDGVTSNIQTQLNAKAASSHVGATGSAHGVVTTSVNGFMSATDKTKLDGIQSGAVTITQGTVQPSVGFWFKEV